VLLYHARAGWGRADDHLLTDEEYTGCGQKGVLPMTAEEYYLQGNEYRRAGNWQQALNCYMEAIALDPDSPAVQAREMINDILNYYCKDMYNP
jgi:tetratricopeptide (TPR) repeat protein